MSKNSSYGKHNHDIVVDEFPIDRYCTILRIMKMGKEAYGLWDVLNEFLDCIEGMRYDIDEIGSKFYPEIGDELRPAINLAIGRHMARKYNKMGGRKSRVNKILWYLENYEEHQGIPIKDWLLIEFPRSTVYKALKIHKGEKSP